MSMRAAINAKCRDCIYDEHEPGNWRQQVTACSSTDCALHALRPVSRPRVERTAKLAPDPKLGGIVGVLVRKAQP